MEKFGIFELLDTLSAITAPGNETSLPEQGEQIKPETDDKAFSAPDFATGGAPAPLPEHKTRTEQNALAALLQKHDSISRKIDGKNK